MEGNQKKGGIIKGRKKPRPGKKVASVDTRGREGRAPLAIRWDRFFPLARRELERAPRQKKETGETRKSAEFRRDRDGDGSQQREGGLISLNKKKIRRGRHPLGGQGKKNPRSPVI